MTHAAPTLLTAAQIRAIVTAMRRWLLACARWLLDMFGEESAIGRAVAIGVRRELDLAARDVRRLVVVLAALRLREEAPLTTSRTHSPIPPHAPRGFRVVRAAGRGRDFTRGTLPRARSLRERIAQLLRTLRHLERAVDRLVKRVRRGPHGAAFTVVAPPPVSLRGRTVAPSGTDTS
jgi:hypothetical protein